VCGTLSESNESQFNLLITIRSGYSTPWAPGDHGHMATWPHGPGGQAVGRAGGRAAGQAGGRAAGQADKRVAR
jgi:hypothetical protein